MAEETDDLIEETNDDAKDWIYYTNEPKTEECSDINSFTDVESDQQLIYINTTSLVVDDNDHIFQYDCEDNLIKNEVQHRDLQDDCNEIEAQAKKTLDSNDDVSNHNLILRESIDENGRIEEEYFCAQCNLSFNNIEDFLNYHPCVNLVSETLEQQEIQQEDVMPTESEDKLWDLVENLEEKNDIGEDIEDVEIKPNVDRNDDSAQQNQAVELDTERYFCYDCKQVFNDLTKAENHDCSDQLQEFTGSTKFKPTSFVNSTDDNVYKCHFCDKDYTSLRSFNNHQRWHKKSKNVSDHTKTMYDQPTVCEICNTVFASEKNLKLHMKMHKKHTVKTIQEALPVGAQNEYNGLNQFFCEICNKSFDQKLLIIHKNMHQKVEEYNCGKCNKQFDSISSYEIHMQMHVCASETNAADEVPSTSSQGFNDGSKRKHACQYCGKEFMRPYEKVKHERIHTGEKPYECEVCGKTFRVSYSLTLHLRTHTDIRPYVCATCNKRFKQQSVYVHHLKTHFVERAYKCDTCGKSFRTSVQLSGHKNIHSKPYNCTECNRPFASLYAVKIHMKTHNKCHKSNKNLKNSCSICGASYARLFALRIHMKEQHGIEVDPTQLLGATNANSNIPNEIDSETKLLMNAAHKANNQQMHFMNTDEDLEDYEVDNEDDEVFITQVDHEENVQNPLPNNIYLDETEAATQTILNAEEITVDRFPTEEIITDWLSK